MTEALQELVTSMKELRKFDYKPYDRYSKVQLQELMKRVDFIGHQVQALTDWAIAQGAASVPQEAKPKRGRPAKTPEPTED